MNKSTLLIAALLCNTVFGQMGNVEVASLPWKQNWKTEIGITTYRTNMLMHNGLLFIGSNGENRNSNNDPKDGVYVINPKDGSIEHHIEGLSLDDNDVNGLAISSSEMLYFGGDAHYVYAYDLNTYTERWKYKVPADVEGVPALADLNGDGVQDVIVNVERKGIWALDGLTGTLIWKTEQYTHDGNVSPLALDLNEDGVADIICGGWNYFALDGKTGEILWEYYKESGVQASPLAILQGDSIQIHLTTSYGDYDILDQNGEALAGVGLTYGLFSSPCPSGESKYIGLGISWYSSNRVASFTVDMSKWNWEEKREKFGPRDEVQFNSEESNRTSATAISLDIDGDGDVEFMLPDEKGILYIIHPEKPETQRYGLPYGAEASLSVFDFNKDSQYELYFAALDGNLYCYQLNDVKSIIWNSFRGNNNNGILDLNND